VALLSSTRAGGGTRPTVLLHGFLGSSRNLRGFAQRWAEREPDRGFLLLDLTGHGSSPPLPPGADLDTLARDVAETVAAAGIGAAPTVLGHSLGGRVALAWARLSPGALGDVVLLDIAPGHIERPRSSSRRVLDVLLAMPDAAPDRRAFRKLLVDGGLAPAVADWVLMNVDCDAAGCRWRIDRRALDALEGRVNGADLWPVVEAGLVRARCIRGERSPYVGDDDVARLEAAGVPVETIAGAGHDLHIEAPEAVLDLIVPTSRA
jgi:pimeloyl-ACP methyl ester carboxylesterase